MPALRKIAFVVNPEKAGAAALARELMAITRAGGVRLKFTARLPLPRGYLKGCDACCVVGGDGTLLGVASEAARSQVPIIGVNRGTLGFLTTFSAEEARARFAHLLRGSFRLDHRAMLACSTGPGVQDLALNDVLIKAEQNTRLVQLEVWADGERVNNYVCDGLLFSTPTGSTAYNLSAGGPIIAPRARVIALTPICPHTLTNRTVIFPDTVQLNVVNRSRASRLLVAVDGQRNLKFGTDAPVRISLARQRLPLAQRSDYEHFAVVRTKLAWGGGYVERG
jgi:NAD+ kinase